MKNNKKTVIVDDYEGDNFDIPVSDEEKSNNSNDVLEVDIDNAYEAISSLEDGDAALQQE